MRLAHELSTVEINILISDYKYDEGLFNEVNLFIRDNGYLNRENLRKVAVWKAPRAKTRVYGVNVNEDEDIVKRITQLALSVTNDKFKIRILCALEGVRVPMSSAILTMADPTKYGVIDVYAWYSLKGKAPKYLNTSDWLWYLQQIRELATKHEKTPREIDKALWQHGYLHLSKDYRRTGGVCPICRR